MKSRNLVGVGAMALALVFVSGSAPAGNTRGRPEGVVRRRHAGKSHLLLTLERVERSVLDKLASRGLTPLAYVPPRGVVVAAWDRASFEGLPVTSAGAFSAGLKVSALVEEEGHFVAEFHPDVSAGDMHAVVQESGLTIREHPDLLARQLLVRGTRQQAERLAEWDEVAHVFPASAELIAGSPVSACGGPATEFGVIAQYVARSGEGWDGPGQNSVALEWVVRSWSDRLPREAQRAELTRAFDEWARYTQISFSTAGSTGRPRTIELAFSRGDHGDGYAFDGPGKALAHTFFPAPPNPETIAGDVHFDDDESWSVGGNVDLFSVALHELGHALGLGHSDSPGTVMYSYYRRFERLSEEDVEAIRRMYAARIEKAPDPAAPPSLPATPPTTPPSPPPSNPATPSAPPPTPPEQPPDSGAENAAPALTIISPAGATVLTSGSTIDMRGTARDSDGVAEVTWSAMAGRSGVASGTANWAATGIPLLTGTNTIVIRARDTKGKASQRSVVVTRR